MRFLLELVACCVSPTAASPGQEISEMSVVPREEETKSLVVVSRRYGRRRRKRGRTGGGAAVSGSAVEWKPSLYAISEDNVVMEKRSETTEESERMVKRKSGSHTRVHVRSYTDDYGRAPLATVVPAFAPTAFLF